MTQALARAIARNRPIVGIGWQPHWMFGRWSLRFLDDPEKVYGGRGSIHTIVRKGVADDDPEVYRVLDRFQRDADAMNLLMVWIEQDLGIEVPDDFLGSAESVRPGASIMTLGYSFGHEQLHTALGVGGVVSAKIRPPNQTALILFDNMVQDGDTGGPLVHVAVGIDYGIALLREQGLLSND